MISWTGDELAQQDDDGDDDGIRGTIRDGLGIGTNEAAGVAQIIATATAKSPEGTMAL